MIGMPGKNAGRAVELFHKHGARQKMRPGRRAKGKKEIRLRPLGLRMPIRRAERKSRLTHAVVAPTPEEVREIFGPHRLAALVQHHGLAGGLRIRDAPACFGQFG